MAGRFAVSKVNRVEIDGAQCRAMLLTQCGRSIGGNSIGDDGAGALGEVLKINTTLETLE